METISIENILKKIPLFEHISNSEYKNIAQKVSVVYFSLGEIIFKENMKADALFCIVAGEVDVLKVGEDGLVEVLAVKKEGDFFGEMSMIDELPRSATIQAKTDVQLLKISRENFLDLLQKYSNISFVVAKKVCQAVRETNDNYIRDLEDKNKKLEIAYNKLREAQDGLIRAEKLSTIGKFASLIVHDIKNPLANIRAYAELIEMTCTEEEEKKIHRCSGIIIKEIDRLVDMTSELLDFARGEMDLQKTPVNFFSYLSTLADMVVGSLEPKHIQLLIYKPDIDFTVIIDIEKMKRVFFNLVANAIDAVQQGGKIEVKLEEVENNYVCWSIRDTGCGIPKEFQDKIFDPFFSKKKKGTGLGMSIIKNIVEKHDGKIILESEEGKGTQFNIYLPFI